MSSILMMKSPPGSAGVPPAFRRHDTSCVSAAFILVLLFVPTVEAAEPASSTCVDVRIGDGGPPDWQCLNSALARQVLLEKKRQDQAAAALDASRPTTPTELNLYNEAATAQRLGSSFGHSVYPERPTETYLNPLMMKK